MGKTKQAPAVAPATGRVKARVLVNGAFGRIDDVVELDAETLQSAGGQVDAHPDAVAWASAHAAGK